MTSTGKAMGEIRLESSRWKGTSFLTVLGGLIGSIVVAVCLLQIDNAAGAKHFDTAQDVIGTTATIAALALLCAALVAAVVFWKRPALTVSDDGVRIYNWRPICLPFRMVKTVNQSSDGAWIFELVNGDQLAAKYAPVAQSESDQELAERVAAAIQVGLGAVTPRTTSVPTRLGLPRRSGRLPTTALVDQRRPLPSVIGWGLGAIIVFPTLYIAGQVAGIQRSSGHAFNFTQWLLAVGATAFTFTTVSTLLWSRFTRRVAVAERWIAVRGRLGPRWKILELSDVVSSDPVSSRKALALCRVTGKGIRLGKDELSVPLASAILKVLDTHPALSDRALRLIQAVATGEPVPTPSAAAPETTPGSR